MKTDLYALTDPDGEVRYIGKTSMGVKRRLICHISAARRGERGYRYNWIRSLLERGVEPQILSLITVDGDGCRDEEIIIETFRASGFRLTNVTSGGEGRPGGHRTAAEKEFLSRFHKGRVITWGAKISAAKRGVKFSEAHKRKLSEAQRTSVVVKVARAARRGKSMPETTYARLQFARRQYDAVRRGLPMVDIEL